MPARSPGFQQPAPDWRQRVKKNNQRPQRRPGGGAAAPHPPTPPPGHTPTQHDPQWRGSGQAQNSLGRCAASSPSAATKFSVWGSGMRVTGMLLHPSNHACAQSPAHVLAGKQASQQKAW